MPNVLVIEDDATTAQSVCVQLRAAGYGCTVESRGEHVLETARAAKPDLVILDVMLPGTSGFEICRRIRRDAGLYTVPILILSAMNSEEEMLHGLAQGADDYVAKPYDGPNLVRRVQQLLRTSAAGGPIDELTALSSADTTKREVQRRLSLGESFSMAYCELIPLREFARKYGLESRERAIRHLARALSQVADHLRLQDQFIGHMGSGHFVSLVPINSVESFCNAVRKVWAGHLESFYATVAELSAMNPRASLGKEQRLDVRFYVTFARRGTGVSIHQLFDTVSQLRNKLLTSDKGGVYLDQRSQG